MWKKLSILLIVFTLVFTCAFDLIFDPEAEKPAEWTEQEVSQLPGTGEDVLNNFETGEEEQNYSETQGGETFPNQPVQQDPLEQPVVEVSSPEPEELPQIPSWEGISEDQVNLLLSLYYEMTPTGKAYSGWFAEGNYSPCSWNGISCDEEGVSGLTFEKVGYFTTFPESLLSFHNLKELHMVDTLVRGPLPESLFADLPKLEKLEFKGNFLTGKVPQLPDEFAFYPMLQEITISDNNEDDRKVQMLYHPEYADVAYVQLDPYAYPDVDLTPGLDGEIPDNWNRLPLLSEIDLSGNQLAGSVPDTLAQLPLRKLDLRDNNNALEISQPLYDYFTGLGNPDIVLEGLALPVVQQPEPTEEPTEIPTEEPTEEPVEEPFPSENPDPGQQQENPGGFLTAPFNPQPEPSAGNSEPVNQPPAGQPIELPTQEPVIEIPTQIPPTEAPTQVPPTEVPTQVPPTQVPTQVPPTPQTIIIVVTATPAPQWVTATPYVYQQPYYYPTATPYVYQQPYYVYPTATPYTNYNPNYIPNWVYPTATSAYSYPQYVQNYSPTQVPTLAPTQDQAALLGFTYKLESMTENNIPMTWCYTGMTEYSINYLDASGNLYPGFAMEWTPASQVCNASACNTSVSVPDELLSQGKFSLQLRVHDAIGNTYVSDPVTMEVSVQQPTPTPEPEQPKSFLSGFFEWLFGPLIRLFGGK